MDLGLKGKVALVLAASSGLGAAIALGLAREGVKVAITGTSQDRLDQVVASIASEGGEALGLLWDLRDLSLIEAEIARIEREWGPIGILINNSGGPPPTPAAGQDVALWRGQFDAMVLSLIAITDRVLPGMRARKFGRILTSTSMGVIAPIPNLGLSNTLRAALVGWSKTLAREVARDGVTVNILAPGRIETDRVRALDAAAAKREGRDEASIKAASEALIPVGRYGRPEEFADMAVFLASARASYITGSTIRVDGGAIASV